MWFNENLQNLRKIKNMSQEQLAEKLEVSRQAVSKWESGNGYPETEKLITICEIFDCSMDDLLKGKISADIPGEKKEYENFQNKFSKGIALAVSVILFGTTILLYFAGLSAQMETSELGKQYEIIGITILLLCVLVAVPVFIILGIEQENFKKRYPKLSNLYSEGEVERFNKKFPKAIALAVTLIMLGTIALIFLYGMNFVDEKSTIPIVVLMSFVTIAVPIFIYFGIQKDKYDISKYNKINSEENKKIDDKIGRICGVIMLIATMIFLFTGIVYNIWYINWIVFPLGGMLCGIVSTILGKE